MTRVDIPRIVQALVSTGKGLFAADETIPTMTRRLASYGIESTPESRRACREMFFSTPGIAAFVSGVILHEETIRQPSTKGMRLTDVLVRQGILAGIRVDDGVTVLADSPTEYVTVGLDGLPARLQEYRTLGASFAKWRAQFSVDDILPSEACLRVNAHALARFAAVCQDQAVVAVVQPDVLMEGPHSRARCEEVTGLVLSALFDEMRHQNVTIENVLLTSNMVIAGSECAEQSSVREVAAATLRCMRRHVPAAVPGIVFASGRQSPLLATMHLGAINELASRAPWLLSFCFGRALQDEALSVWQRNQRDVQAGQRAFYHRARCVSAAALGLYTTSMETSAAPADVQRVAKRVP